MKRRDVAIQVSDHAVLRYLERGHGLDIAMVRRHLAGLAVNGAVLGALAVRVEDVRLYLHEQSVGDDRFLVTVSTVGRTDMRKGRSDE